MLTDCFYWLVNMSITGSVAGLAVVLLRLIRRIPRRAVFALWLIPFLRFWIPVGLGSPRSIWSLSRALAPGTVTVLEQADTVYTMMNHTLQAESYFPILYKAQAIAAAFRVASIVWWSIAVILGLLAVSGYISGIREAKRGTRLQENLFLSREIAAPEVRGIFRPVILVPDGCEARDIRFILLHEKAHIRRRDNLWRALALATAIIHWFNPLVWLFLKLFLEDMELACDECVLRQCGPSERKDYALALVQWAESRNLFSSSFGGAGIRSRIGRILTYRKLSIFSLICVLMLFAVVAWLFLTNPV